MNNEKRYTIHKNAILDGKYTVLLFIKKGRNAETYRVKGTNGKLYFLKLFNPAKLHHSAFDGNGNLLEIEFLKTTKHENIVSYKDSGEVIVDGKKFLYLVLNFIAGETLAERMTRESISTVFDIRQILSGVLSGLQYLHSLSEPIIHNEITPQNIMLDLSGDTPQAKIIDFGFARSFLQSSKTYCKEGLNLNLVASECITANTFSPQSDLFSVGAVMYQMLFGTQAWNVSISDYATQMSNDTAVIEKLLQQREKPLLFPNVADRIVDFDNSVLAIISKALQTDTEKRFQSAQEFSQALNGEIEIVDTVGANCIHPDQKNEKTKIQKRSGGGFSAIAGMQTLKNMLQTDVIDIIRHPDEYKKHGLGLPNGMLLYAGLRKNIFCRTICRRNRL